MKHRNLLLLAGIIAAAFLARLATLALSPFGWYHGFNEVVYTQIADSYTWTSWIPVRDGQPFFDTGPLTTWLMAAMRGVLGPTELASRFGVLLALPVAAAAVAALSTENQRARVAIFTTSPFVLLWFGRAQTDAWMVAGVLVYLAGLRWIHRPAGFLAAIFGIAAAVMSKQPAILAAVAVAFTARRDLAIMATAAGLALGGAWWVLMLLLEPDAFLSSLQFHVQDRFEPFENAALTVVLTSYCLLPLVIGATRTGFLGHWTRHKMRLAVVAAVFLAFALWQAPAGHEYYALPAIAILAVMPWNWTRKRLTAAVALGVVLSGALLWYAGDLGDDRVIDTAALVQDVDEDVYAWPQLRPQLMHYADRDILILDHEPTTALDAYAVWPGPSRDCTTVAAFERLGVSWWIYDCRMVAV